MTAIDAPVDAGGPGRSWAGAEGDAPLHHHSVLSDQRTLAVVNPHGDIVWMCLPRADGPSVFASLLGGDDAGCWRVRPAGDRPGAGAAPHQAYVGDTLILRTQWPTFGVTDYLDGAGGRSFQRAGRTDLIRVVEGRGVARVEFAPRLDFGRGKVRLLRGGGEHASLVVEGADDPLVLAWFGAPVEWEIHETGAGPVAVALIDLDRTPSGSVTLELRSGTRSTRPARLPEPERREQNARLWSAWAASLRLPSVAPEACKRSALMLRSLVHGPTGAILAAATTSLPEEIGGVRNWDYRFCWPRDAAISAAALVRLGNTGIAMKFLDWLLAVVDRSAGPERLRPIYTVTGSHLGPEAELPHLAGYRGSRPVRLGNAASTQVQLDVFGPIVELVALLADAGAAISPDHWRLVEAMVLAVERRWQEPDHGVWEIRTNLRHHVHSRAMGWLAADRGARLAQEFLGTGRESWKFLSESIRGEVLARGFDPGLNAFVAAYDLHEPDAAALTLGLCGLVPADDPRFVGTVDLIAQRLLDRGTVRRYLYDDGLPGGGGGEGGFHLCTGWLVDALSHLGRLDQAHALFDSLLGAMGPTGVLTEEWCPNERTGLGNLMQGYSHAAIIQAAWALDRAARGTS